MVKRGVQRSPRGVRRARVQSHAGYLQSSWGVELLDRLRQLAHVGENVPVKADSVEKLSPKEQPVSVGDRRKFVDVAHCTTKATVSKPVLPSVGTRCEDVIEALFVIGAEDATVVDCEEEVGQCGARGAEAPGIQHHIHLVALCNVDRLRGQGVELGDPEILKARG